MYINNIKAFNVVLNLFHLFSKIKKKRGGDKKKKTLIKTKICLLKSLQQIFFLL